MAKENLGGSETEAAEDTDLSKSDSVATINEAGHTQENSKIAGQPSPERETDNEDKFEPPGMPDLASLTDGRREGQFGSIYSFWAWTQITLELAYLLFLLLGSFSILALMAKYILMDEKAGLVFSYLGPRPSSDAFISWVAITLGGTCGGCSSALKWLYHTVAKKRWHRDRLVWRLVVPVLSAMLAVFLGLMIRSGLVPFLNKTPLNSPASGAAFGFFVGIFSDNVLSGLQKLAFRTFGTVDRKPD